MKLSSDGPRVILPRQINFSKISLVHERPIVEIIYDLEFEKQSKRLEPRFRKKLALQLERIAQNPYDSRLYGKPLSEPFEGAFSFRITRDWRVSYRFQSATVIHLLEVKHRKDIYR